MTEHSDLSASERVFVQWVYEGALDIEGLCSRHPAHAPRLRELWQDWEEDQELRNKADLAPLAVISPRTATTAGATERHDAANQILHRLTEQRPRHSRYKELGEVGRGRQGAIVRVIDSNLSRELAKKVLLSDASAEGGPTQADLTRFLEEARISGQLDHSGIVPVHELGVDLEGRIYFTMKLVQGRDFKAVLDLVFHQREGWNETRALGVLLKVCEAMSYAHSKGVVHRDLKPANVMVGDYGEVYVMDWGLARDLGRSDTKDIRIDGGRLGLGAQSDSPPRPQAGTDWPLLTMDGDVLGTPAYMPVEQGRGDIARVGPQSDVYAIGAMLYHLLAGRPPYALPDEKALNPEMLARLLDGPPTPLDEIRTDVPAELLAICGKAMAREPQDRYVDTRHLADDLRAYLERRVVAAYERGAFAELKKWVVRNKAFAGTLGAAGVGLLAGSVIIWILKVRSDRNAAYAGEQTVKALGAAEHLKSANQYISEVVTTLLSKTGDELPQPPAILGQLGLFDEASHQVARLIEIEEARLPVNHPALLQYKLELAALLSAQGKTEEAAQVRLDARRHEPVPELRIMPASQLQYRLSRETRTTTSTRGAMIPLVLRYEQTLSLTVASSGADQPAHLALDLHYGDLRGTFESPVKTIELDSQAVADYPAMFDPVLVPHLESVGHDIRVVLSQCGRVESVTGWEQVFAHVEENRKAMLDLTDENLFRTMQVFFALLPEGGNTGMISWETTYPYGFGKQVILFRPLAVVSSSSDDDIGWTFGTNVSPAGQPQGHANAEQLEAGNPRWMVEAANIKGASLFGRTVVSRADGFLKHQRVEIVVELEQRSADGVSAVTTAVDSLELRRL